MAKTNRRVFLKSGILGGTLGLFARSAQALSATPEEMEGPFYPVVAQKDRDLDLTRIAGRQGTALGRKILVQGQVLDTQGKPVENATIDLWHANAAGRYRHPHDSNPAPLDPNFQGWAIIPSGAQGRFRFISVFPGSYPASNSWTRPPHIHFKITKKGYRDLITQMYFPGHELNDVDRLLQRKSAEEQQRMIARKVQNTPETYDYTIVVQKL